MTIRVATWCAWPVRAADGETIMDPTTLQPVKDAFALFREGLAAVRDAKALLPAAQQEAVTITLEKAGTAASLAEAQIAKALGFPTSRVHLATANHACGENTKRRGEAVPGLRCHD